MRCCLLIQWNKTYKQNNIGSRKRHKNLQLFTVDLNQPITNKNKHVCIGPRPCSQKSIQAKQQLGNL